MTARAASTIRVLSFAAACSAALLGASCASAPVSVGVVRDSLWFSVDADSAGRVFLFADGRVTVHDSAVVVEITSGQVTDPQYVGELSAAVAAPEDNGAWRLLDRSERKGPSQYLQAGQMFWVPLRFVVPTTRAVTNGDGPAQLVLVLERHPGVSQSRTPSASAGPGTPGMQDVSPVQMVDRRVVPLELRRTPSTRQPLR